MTAKFVDYMETLAYNLAQRDIPCWSDYQKDRTLTDKIAMTELFDMFAGSETGAIIASSLVMSDTNDKSKPKYLAKESLQWFMQHLDDLYYDAYIELWIKILIVLVALVLVGLLAEMCTQLCFMNRKYRTAFRDVKLLYDFRKD